ncbi:hypothetical protein BSKO_07063 [Bryopsis sp. KO-2023]|nr:hypothetical protein BSKO_07063 [Bryopsis sp. KO-2023]
MCAFHLHKQLSVRDYAFQYAQNAKSWLRDYCTAIKWRRWHPFTPLERKAREATRNEPWGPTGMMLNDLADESTELDNAQVIMAVLELRLGYPVEKWRNVYKALQVLEFLLKRGSDHCLRLAKDDLQGPLSKLLDFEYVGPDGRDYGINVRVRAQAIDNLMADEEQLLRDRAQLKSRTNKQFKGFSRTDMESFDGVGRANSWAGAIRNSSLRDEENSGHRIAQPPAQQQQTLAQPSRRGAGEMKGVSLEENKKNLAVLKELMSRGKNKTCADCVGGSRPTWASINCGVFICMRCAGIHRGLGVHISIVRSCTLDTWLPDQIQFMARTGNEVANAYWEGNLPAGTKPNCESSDLGAFIRRKYCQKGFAVGEWPPPTPASPTIQESQGPARPTSVQRQTSDAREQSGGLFWESQRGQAGTSQPQTIMTQGDMGVYSLSADVATQPSAFQTHPSPPMAVPSPVVHHKPTESLLFHAHTYPDLLSFDDDAFATGPAGRPVGLNDFGGDAFGVAPSQPSPRTVPDSSNNVPSPTTNVPTVQYPSLQQPERTLAKPKPKPRPSTRQNANIIQTNELDLDDLDDVESVGGVSRARIQRPSPAQRQPSVGFGKDAVWGRAPNAPQQRAQFQQPGASSNPFDDPKPSPQRRAPEGSRPVQRASQDPPGSNMVSSPHSVNPPAIIPERTVAKPRDPLNELVDGFSMDLLSAPPPRAISMPTQRTPGTPPTNMVDPFADLEPLEALLSPPPTPQSAAGTPTSAREHVSPATPMHHPATSPSHHYQQLAPRQSGQVHPGNPFSQPGPGPFIGEGGRMGGTPSQNMASVGGSPTVGNYRPQFGGTPAGGVDFGRQMYGGIMQAQSGVSGGWSSPKRDFSEIDRLVLKEVEALQASGAKASGALGHPRGLTANMRKPSIKETRAFAGSG